MRSRLVVLVATMCVWSACSPEMVNDTDAGTDAGGTFVRPRDAGVDAGVPVPLKVIFLLDASQSVTVTDPNGERVNAVLDAMRQLPQTDDVSVAVLLFSGTTLATLSPTGLNEFTRMPDWTPAVLQTLQSRVLNFVPPGTGPFNTDFVKPLSDAYALIYVDAMSALTNNLPKSTYTLIFVSDGRPTFNQDDELLCGDAVRRIRNLRLYANDVFVHTVHLFKPTTTPTCTGDAGVTVSGSACLIPSATNPGVCPAADVELDAARLRAMATLGAGQFRDFRGGQAVNFTPLIP